MKHEWERNINRGRLWDVHRQRICDRMIAMYTIDIVNRCIEIYIDEINIYIYVDRES